MPRAVRGCEPGFEGFFEWLLLQGCSLALIFIVFVGTNERLGEKTIRGRNRINDACGG
jgi:hypothetical protein